MESYSETYPDHLTIIQDGGDNQDSERSDLATSDLQKRIKELLNNQQQGGAKKKKSGSKRKSSSRGGARDPTPLKAWQKIVNHIYKHIKPLGKKLKDAMTEASKIRKSVIAKKPHLEKEHMKLADATIEEFNMRTKKR
jgi:hypothetical protein